MDGPVEVRLGRGRDRLAAHADLCPTGKKPRRQERNRRHRGLPALVDVDEQRTRSTVQPPVLGAHLITSARAVVVGQAEGHAPRMGIAVLGKPFHQVMIVFETPFRIGLVSQNPSVPSPTAVSNQLPAYEVQETKGFAGPAGRQHVPAFRRQRCVFRRHAGPTGSWQFAYLRRQFRHGIRRPPRLAAIDRQRCQAQRTVSLAALAAHAAGCRAVPVPADERWSIRLDAISDADAERALVLWVNTPGNPAGGLDDLAAAARWGRERDVPVFSDECYAEFTWDGRPRTILTPAGADTAAAARAEVDGVVAVHSLSKRSNLAGVRVGFYGGDPDLVHFLREVRKHAGFMVPGPAQAAAVAALSDQVHVAAQRERYRSRLERLARIVGRFGPKPALPRGGFYLWAAAPGGDAWAFTRTLLSEVGILVSPGEFYGPSASRHVRVAAVLTDDVLDLVESRLA